MAPELHAPPDCDEDDSDPQSIAFAATKESDVYAFSMLALSVSPQGSPRCAVTTDSSPDMQTMTSKLPFCHLYRDSTVIWQAIEGKRPLPAKYNYTADDPLWLIFAACWKQAPELRPGMVEVVQFFQARRLMQ
jgi:hypothetical protein